MSQALVNGPMDGQRYIDNIDPDDPEYVRQLRRPAEVKQDMRQMEERSRVTVVLKSEAFRKELEELVTEQLLVGPRPTGLVVLQQISQLLQPDAKKTPGAGGDNSTKSAIIPINDLKGSDSQNFSKLERAVRCKLASFYRVADIFGWLRGVRSYITIRFGQDTSQFLIAPQGVGYHEITASSLVKVNANGQIIDAGSTVYEIDKACNAIHTAIHNARPDLRCIVHLRSPITLAISVLGNGLLPISPEAIVVGDIKDVDLSEYLPLDEKQEELTKALGSTNKVFILKNFGIIVGGETIEEAYYLCKNVVAAAETQLLALPVGVENIAIPSEEARARMRQALTASPSSDDGRRQWKRGELEYEALMRQLDSAGYQTGYSHREPVLKRDYKPERINTDVEIPPALTSVGQRDDQQSPKRVEKYDAMTKFTPNAYRKEESADGAPGPDHLGKKFTKWVPEDGVGGVIKVNSPNQFAVLGKDAKEYKNKYQEIRKEYFTEKVSAGPQSKVLEGVTWEEAQAIQEGKKEGPKDTVIVVGAASMGVLKRDHQHDPHLFQVYYPPNPFDNVTTQEIENYTADIERKRRIGAETDTTDTEALEEGPEGRLISSNERQQHLRQPIVTDSDTQGGADSDVPSSPTKVKSPEPNDNRTQSAKIPPQKATQIIEGLQQNLARTQSERQPAPPVVQVTSTATPASPTKSTSSVEAPGTPATPSKSDTLTSEKSDKKKKKKFHMPSFGKKDKKEKKEKGV